jgi:hypothetical protein
MVLFQSLREEHRLRPFQNKMLRKIFGPKRDEVTGEWSRLHNKELYAVYASPNVFRMIKSRRLRWAGHVARMGKRRDAYRVLVEKADLRRRLGRPRSGWGIILKWIFEKWVWRAWTGSIWIRIGTGCELL